MKLIGSVSFIKDSVNLDDVSYIEPVVDRDDDNGNASIECFYIKKS